MIAVLGGLGAAATWALSTLCSSRSSRLIGAAPVVAWVMLIGLLITGPLAAQQGLPARLDASAAGWLVISGAGNVGGLLLEYKALRTGNVALVAPLVCTEGAIAALISLASGEAIGPAPEATLAVIAAGACLSSVSTGDATTSHRGARPAA